MTASLMLATPADSVDGGPDGTIARLMGSSDEWWFEFKFDGIRALCTVVDGRVTITNRTGRDITFRYPDVVATMTGLSDMVLDGEIVCVRDGRPDFPLVHRRDAQGSARAAAQLAAVCPAQFVAFDVLSRAGVDLRALPYSARRQHLVEVSPELSDHRVTLPPVNRDGRLMWEAVCNLGLEGLIAKRADSRYVGRRTGAWVKIKLTHRVTALVAGWDAGEGSRARTFGALRLVLLDEAGELVPVGSVGSGFTEADVALLWQRLQTEDHPILVDVAYLEVSPSGTLRQPVFKGMRLDLEPTDCTVSQLRQQ